MIDGSFGLIGGAGLNAKALAYESKHLYSKFKGFWSNAIPKKQYVSGTAFRHQTKWAQNPSGPRTKAEALALADEHGVYIADDVHIVFVEDSFYERRFSSKFGDSYASYGHVELERSNTSLTWNTSVSDKNGEVNLYVRNSVLSSDEAIIAILHHETHEIEALREIFAKRVSLSPREYRRLINATTPRNLHWEAVDVGDLAVLDFRRVSRGNIAP